MKTPTAQQPPHLASKERTMSRSHLVLLGAAALAASTLGPKAASAAALESNRFAERPAGQAGVNSTSSTMVRSYLFPVGTDEVSFDYFVDSEPNFDFLKVYVDNVVQWSMSGLNKAGHKAFSVAAGPHNIKFEYVKDGSVSRGLDTARIDNVAFTSSAGGGVVAMERFDTTDTLASHSWLPAGASGGWTIPGHPRNFGAGRPKAQVNVNSSTSYMEKTVSLSGAASPWFGAVELDYYVDSETNYDFLQVLVDGVVKWSKSGRHKSGHKVVPIAGAGNHTVRFQYSKDGSLSAGNDTARVDHVRFVNGDGVPLEVNDFDGRTPETAPIAVAGGTAEWTSGGTGGGWVVHRELPPLLYAPRQTSGQQLTARYKTFVEPVVDGSIDWRDEYVNPTRTPLFNFADPAGPPGVVGFVSSTNATNNLYLALRVKSGTGTPSMPVTGSEAGQITLYFDASRPLTLNDTGTCASPQLPGNEDRRLDVTYSNGTGVSASTVTVSELRGGCASGSGAWVALGANAAWLPDPATQIKISEPPLDPGFMHIELMVKLPAAVVADGRVGVGLRRWNTANNPSEERLPSSDTGAPFADDVYSWSTLELSMPTSTSNLEQGLSAVARPDRSPLLWSR